MQLQGDDRIPFALHLYDWGISASCQEAVAILYFIVDAEHFMLMVTWRSYASL